MTSPRCSSPPARVLRVTAVLPLLLLAALLPRPAAAAAPTSRYPPGISFSVQTDDGQWAGPDGPLRLTGVPGSTGLKIWVRNSGATWLEGVHVGARSIANGTMSEPVCDLTYRYVADRDGDRVADSDEPLFPRDVVLCRATVSGVLEDQTYEGVLTAWGQDLMTGEVVTSEQTVRATTTEPPVSLGDLVWLDRDRDGVQDSRAEEPGIEGVRLTVTGPDGRPVEEDGQPLGRTTDAAGRYSFAGLAPLADPGRYTVHVDPTSPALRGLAPTAAGAGTEQDDSSTWSARSGPVDAPAASDRSLDFGFAPVTVIVRVGDRVWRDSDRDGRQDSGERGIAGVRLTLTGPDGGPVRDVRGTPVGPTRTGWAGHYAFTRLPLLPAGQAYTVHVDPTSPALRGLDPTRAGAGAPAHDSSTGSATSAGLSADRRSDTTLDFGFVRATH